MPRAAETPCTFSLVGLFEHSKARGLTTLYRLSTVHLIHDERIIAGVLQRLNEDHLPRALSLKKKVDNGQTLNDFDLNFWAESITMRWI